VPLHGVERRQRDSSSAGIRSQWNAIIGKPYHKIQKRTKVADFLLGTLCTLRLSLLCVMPPSVAELSISFAEFSLSLPLRISHNHPGR
jgi:hypothetical protein